MKWQHWKTRTKLLVGFGIVVLLTVFISTFGIRNNMQNRAKAQILAQLMDVQRQLLTGRLNTRAYMDLKDTSFYNTAASSLTQCINNFRALQSNLTLDENIRLAAEFDTLVNSYFNQLQRLHALIEKQNITAQQRRDTRDAFIKGFEQTRLSRDNDVNVNYNEGRLYAVYLLSGINEDYYKKAMSSLDKAVQAAEKQKKTGLIALIEDYRKTIEVYYNTGVEENVIDAGLKSKGTRMTGILNNISDNTLAYVDRWNKAASFNFGIVTLVIIVVSVIVIYLITTYFTRMLGEGVKLAETYSGGDLTYTIPREHLELRDEMGNLNRAVAAMGEKLRSVVADIYLGASQVADASQQINSTTQQISQGANEQASSVEQVSSSMEQMLSNIQMNSDNAHQTEKIATVTASEVRNLSSVSDKSLDSVRQISGKIGIINDIAFQTNILALNAAVEAARAGENGRGFAVVAAEVRKLAERSRMAANEIMELAHGSLHNTEASVSQMVQLMPEIERTSLLIQEIASSNRELNSGTDQINAAIQQLNMVTQQNASASEELASSAEELSSQANQLRDTVSFFKIDHRAGQGQATGKSGSHSVAVSGKKQPVAGRPQTGQQQDTTEHKGVRIKLTESHSDDDFEKY